MKTFSKLIIILLILASGHSFSQQSTSREITNIERDSIVNKILRGEKCLETYIKQSGVVAQQGIIISELTKTNTLRDSTIQLQAKQIDLFKSNEISFGQTIDNHIEIAKVYKKQKTWSTVKWGLVAVVAFFLGSSL